MPIPGIVTLLREEDGIFLVEFKGSAAADIKIYIYIIVFAGVDITRNGGNQSRNVCRAARTGKPSGTACLQVRMCEIVFNLRGIGVEKRFPIQAYSGNQAIIKGSFKNIHIF